MRIRGLGAAIACAIVALMILSACASGGGESETAGPPAVKPAKVWLGVLTRDVEFPPSAATDGAAGGSRVEILAPGAPAEKAGVRDGDVILWIGGRPTPSTLALVDALKAVDGPKAIPVTVLREGKKVVLSASVEERPADADQRYSKVLIDGIGAEQKAASDAESAGDAKKAFDHYLRAERLLMLQNRYYRAGIDQAMDFDIAHMAELLKKRGLRPGVPAEADRHNRRAVAILRTASTDEDNDRAAFEFSEAIYEAPWVPDLHLNRGLALEKAGYTEAAIVELRQYLVLDPGARDAGAVRQKITELEVLAEERRAWVPFIGPWTYASGNVENLALRGRKLTLTLATRSASYDAADRPGDVLCYGTIHGREMGGKCIDRPNAENDIRCLGANEEFNARGRIDASNTLVIESYHVINYNVNTCQINWQKWGVFRTLRPRAQ